MNSDTGTSRRRPVYLALGTACLVIGLSLISLALYGSIFPEGEPDHWVYVRPVIENPAPSAVAAAVATPAPPLGDQQFRLVIEKIGVDAPVATFGLDENAVPQVPYEAGLVAWYDFSARPGSGGNAVFAGHYTWRGDAVFRRLDQLQHGDRIVLRGENGAELVYQVSTNEVVDPSDANALHAMRPTDADVITLITCGGAKRLTSDPIFGAEYDKRQVVRATFVSFNVSQPAPPGASGG